MFTCGASRGMFKSLHRTSWRYSHFLDRGEYRFPVSMQRMDLNCERFHSLIAVDECLGLESPYSCGIL
jgi:hypothetical protein